jgi:CRISPR-associated protein Cst1
VELYPALMRFNLEKSGNSLTPPTFVLLYAENGLEQREVIMRTTGANIRPLSDQGYSLEQREVIMRTTGHAFVDIGEAVLHALAKRPPMDALADDDLRQAAEWLAEKYTQPGPLRNLMSGMIFLNAGYIQANPAIREPYVKQVLYSWQASAALLEDRCAFCGDLAAYRANRESLPLFTGRDIINFSPAGRAGLPVCGRCSLALHAMLIGCAKSGGFLIAPYCDDPQVTYDLVNQNVRHLMKLLSMPDIDKIPGSPFERNRLIEMLIGWITRTQRRTSRPVSLTGYCFTNSGQNPDLVIYRLDAAVVGWLETLIHHADSRVQKQWWHMAQASESVSKKHDNATRNALYEALFELPATASDFFRRFICPQRSWTFASLYLEKIMSIKPAQIQQIKTIGERFAQYARERPAFVYGFTRTRHFPAWRRVILNAADDCSKRYGYTLISLDEFIELFVPKEDASFGWELARDLITLIMIEARVTQDAETLFDPETITTEEND